MPKIHTPDWQTQIMLALGEHYALTIKQTMRLYNWLSYPHATEKFKKLVDAGYIYRVRRRGFSDAMGDAYILLTKGKMQLEESSTTPVFSFSFKQAQELSIVPLTHTLFLNNVLINFRLFEKAHLNSFRLQKIEHERAMRKSYGNTFGLYPDGFVFPIIKVQKRWFDAPFFLEVEHTTSADKANWQEKVHKYLELFEQKLQTYFQTDTVFVLTLITDPHYLVHQVRWTEEILTQTRKKDFANWFVFGDYQRIDTPLFLTEKAFFTPFTKAAGLLFEDFSLPLPPSATTGVP